MPSFLAKNNKRSWNNRYNPVGMAAAFQRCCCCDEEEVSIRDLRSGSQADHTAGLNAGMLLSVFLLFVCMRMKAQISVVEGWRIQFQPHWQLLFGVVTCTGAVRLSVLLWWFSGSQHRLVSVCLCDRGNFYFSNVILFGPKHLFNLFWGETVCTSVICFSCFRLQLPPTCSSDRWRR